MSTFTNPTLANIRQRVRFYIDEPVQANFTDSDLNYAINDAQQYVANEITQVDENYMVSSTPTIINILANQQYYALPLDFNKCVRVVDTTTGISIPFSDINSQNVVVPQVLPNVAYGGVGFNAIIVGNSIGFTPIPTSNTFTPVFYYVPNVPDLVADTDVSIIPRNFIDLVAIQASIDARIKDEDDTSALERKYDRLIKQLTRTARNRQQSTPKKVQRVTGLSGYAGLR